MTDSTSDSSIPLLTEIVAPNASAAATPAATKPATSAAPAANPPKPAAPAAMPARAAAAPVPAAAATDGHAMPPLTEEEWSRLENAIHQRIARQVLERIDFVLDHRVRHSLTDVVDRAVDSLAAEIKSGLHGTLNEIVERAVAQEISRLQALKK